MKRSSLAIILLLISIPFNIAQQVVYQGTITKLSILQVKEYQYKWELYRDSTLNFAAIPGDCPSTDARFTGENTGPVVNVEWLLPGIYFYKVAVQDATRCTNNVRIERIRVIAVNLKPVISGESEMGMCQEIILDAAGSEGDPVKYEWSLLDQGILLSPLNAPKTVLTVSTSFKGPFPAFFRIKLQITDKKGVNSNEVFTVKVNQAPLARIFPNTQPEADGSIIVNGTLSSGKGLRYHWTTEGGGFIGPVDNSSARLTGNGNYSLQVTDVYGCKSEINFIFPIELYQIKAYPDHVTTSWSEEIGIYVLNNDQSTAPLLPNSLIINNPPAYGKAEINQDGSILYTPNLKKKGKDQFSYKVCDAVGLCSSATVFVLITDEEIKLPTGFSPNGDGINDLLVFQGLESYNQSAIHIYSRSGQLVYQSFDYKNEWDGTIRYGSVVSSDKVPSGVYYYILEVGNTNRNIRKSLYIGY